MLYKAYLCLSMWLFEQAHQNRKNQSNSDPCAKIICNFYGSSRKKEKESERCVFVSLLCTCLYASKGERKKRIKSTFLCHMTFDRNRIARATKMNNVHHTLHIAHIHTTITITEYYKVLGTQRQHDDIDGS